MTAMTPHVTNALFGTFASAVVSVLNIYLLFLFIVRVYVVRMAHSA